MNGSRLVREGFSGEVTSEQTSGISSLSDSLACTHFAVEETKAQGECGSHGAGLSCGVRSSPGSQRGPSPFRWRLPHECAASPPLGPGGIFSLRAPSPRLLLARHSA